MPSLQHDTYTVVFTPYIRAIGLLVDDSHFLGVGA